MPDPRVLVIVPTFNERANLPTLHRRLRAAVPAAELLVVDDNSPDGTGVLADELAASDPAVHVLHRPGKGGLGAAYLAGFSWALERGFDVVVEMDADGSHAPEQLPDLLTAVAGGADLALGSRYVPGGRLVGWPRRREWLSRGGNMYVRWMLRLAVHDATGGYRAYRRAVLESIELAGVDSAGYCFQVDLVRRTLAARFSVREVPITFTERQLGQSKMTGAIVREALLRVTGWGVRDRLGRR